MVVAHSMVARPDEDDDMSRSWYVRCHAQSSPGETRLAGTLPVLHAPNRTVPTRVPLGDFALGAVQPEDRTLECAFYQVEPNTKQALVSHAELSVARFADADDGIAVLEFSKGERSKRWITLELRCDDCGIEREDAPETKTLETATATSSESVSGWRTACIAFVAVAAVEAIALVAILCCHCTGVRNSDEPLKRKRVKRKTSDAPGVFLQATLDGTGDRERARAGARVGFNFESNV